MLDFYMVDWVLFKFSEWERDWGGEREREEREREGERRREEGRKGGGRERQKWRMAYFGFEDQKQLWKFLSWKDHFSKIREQQMATWQWSNLPVVVCGRGYTANAKLHAHLSSPKEKQGIGSLISTGLEVSLLWDLVLKLDLSSTGTH